MNYELSIQGNWYGWSDPWFQLGVDRKMKVDESRNGLSVAFCIGKEENI